MAAVAAAGMEIGEIPKVKDAGRRKEALSSSEAFADIYLHRMFTSKVTGTKWPWADYHHEIFRRGDKAMQGGKFAVGAPRGGAKTNSIRAVVLRAVLGGLQKWGVILAATADKSEEHNKSIRIILETNAMLAEDFPEAIFPILALRRSAARAIKQTCGGRLTRMEWSSDCIVFPDIEGSACAGSIITTCGMEAADIRGQNRTMPDGSTLRPTFAMLDDPTTDEVSKSPYQTDKRWDVINGAVMHMCAPDAPLCMLAAVTVIETNDIADRLLNDPQWNSIRCPMLVSMPLHRAGTPTEIPHADFWDKYASELKDNHADRALAIYRDHACKPECVPLLDQPRPCKDCEIRMNCMDADAIVSWRHRRHAGDLTAIQHAMDIHIRNPRMFASEMQQRPLNSRIDSARITPAQVMRRISGLRMGDVPGEASHIVAAVDVHKAILYYSIAALENDYTGQVIEYGTFPKQPARWFRQADPPVPLSRVFPGLDENATIFAGVEALCDSLLKREFFKRSAAGVTPMQVEKLLVDGRYGTKLIHGVRRKLRSPVLETVLGVGIGPNKKPITMYDRSRATGNMVGDNWYRPLITNTQEFPHVMADVNYWKTQAQRALALAPGTRGAVTLFGEPGTEAEHEPWAEHVAGSEYPTEMPPDSFGRVVTVYAPFPGGPDNHWLDTFVYCFVAASILGCKFPVERTAQRGLPTPVIRPRPERRESSYRAFDPAMG